MPWFNIKLGSIGSRPSIVQFNTRPCLVKWTSLDFVSILNKETSTVQHQHCTFSFIRLLYRTITIDISFILLFYFSPPLTRRSQRNQRDRGRNNESNQVRDIKSFLKLWITDTKHLRCTNYALNISGFGPQPDWTLKHINIKPCLPLK